MDGNFGETSDRGSSEIIVVPELEGVGLARPHSALVKIVTSATAQNSIGDVIKAPLNDVIKTSLNDVIKTTVSDVIKSPTPSIEVIKTDVNGVKKSSSVNVIKTTVSDVIKVPVKLEDNIIRTKEVGHSACSSSISSSSVTTSITTTSLDEGKIISPFHIEQDWREAAQDLSLTVRCKKTTGELVKNRFGSGSRGKCILLGKDWYTPTEFEAHCGRSASKDWKRSIRFQGQSLLTLIEEGFLQVHATSCSCSICLDDNDAAGTVRLHRPYKRKRRDKIFLSTELSAKVLKRTVSEEPGSTMPTVTLPVSEIGDLTVVPGLVLSSGTPPVQGSTLAAAPVSTSQATPVPSVNCNSPGTLANLPLEKAWERMNEVLVGLERSVSGARTLLEELKERTQEEVYNVRQKLLSEKEDAVTQAKLEVQFSNMAKSSEGFLVQVRDEDTGQSLQPIMLDSLISNIPPLDPAPLINGVRKKCVNCNRESELECSGCHNKAYCSDFCQRRDWINHQSECTRSSPPPEDPLNVTQVADDLGFFHPCEVSIVEELLNIASHHKRIKNFYTEGDTVQVNNDPKTRGGLYLSSLAGALKNAVKVYDTSVVQVEQQIIDDPELPLSHILNALQPLAPLLAALASLVAEIEERKPHGCKILEVLHKNSALSVSYIRETFVKIEQTVHSVLYDQLTHWMLYGNLIDPHNELFIRTVSTCIENPTNIQDPSQTDAINLLEFEAPKVYDDYILEVDMLPNHIPLHIAEKILFIGESILVFEREGKKDTGIDFSSVPSRIGLVLKNKEKEYLQLLHSLADSPFSIIEFSKVVETIRHCVSREVCELVMDADLVTVLHDLKAVYFLGRGELYQTLIPSLTHFMQTADSTNDFNALFQLAGRQVLLEDDMLSKFSLKRKTSSVDKTVSRSSESSGKSWNTLRIEYNAKWPLHKLFTSRVQDKYNAIFNFLLDMRRAQYRLQQLWIVQMKTKNLTNLDSLAWTSRHQMSLLVDNIQYYLQVDVLESQHWQLIGEIDKTSDYQRLATLHHNFLESVAAQCFMNNGLIWNRIYVLLNLVNKFCSILEEQHNIGTHQRIVSERQKREVNWQEEIKMVSSVFQRDCYNLFFLLSELSVHQRSQYTSQLVMRIDYNKFYSTNAKTFRSIFDAERSQ